MAQTILPHPKTPQNQKFVLALRVPALPDFVSLVELSLRFPYMSLSPYLPAPSLPPKTRAADRTADHTRPLANNLLHAFSWHGALKQN